MPKGIPPAQLLTSRRLQAFALDTSVIEGTGFRMDSGPIRHLSSQLPPWMQLWMPKIVINEVNAHRFAHVEKGIQLIRTGIQELNRHMGDSLVVGNMKWLDGALHIARETFDDQINRFIKAHSGIVIDLSHPDLSEMTFDRYFKQLPPFEGSKDKKSEFPDAAILIALELKAKEFDCELIVVSRDTGWSSYADSSDRIYCVNDIQSLAALYVSTSSLAKILRDSLSKSLESPKASLRQRLAEVVQKGLRELPWRLQTPKTYGIGIDAGLLDVRMIDMNPNPAAVGVWITSANEESGVVEVGIDVSLVLTIEAVAFEELWSGEKLDLARTEFDIDHHSEVKLILEMKGDLSSSDPWPHVINLELRPDPMPVNIKQVDFGGDVGVIPGGNRWRRSHDGFEDDIPF